MSDNVCGIIGLIGLDKAINFIERGKFYLVCEKQIDYVDTLLKTIKCNSEKDKAKVLYIDVFQENNLINTLNNNDYDIAIINYYQGIDVSSKYTNRNDELDFVARQIKKITKIKGVAVIMGAVMNVGGCIRDTGSCFNLADTIIIIDSDNNAWDTVTAKVIKKDNICLNYPEYAGEYARCEKDDIWKIANIHNNDIKRKKRI